MLLLINIMVVLSSIVGMYLIAHYNRLGFAVFLITEACFISLGVITGQYGLIITAFIYLGMNIYSWRKWGGTPQ
jgi:hypothetical protein